MWHDFACASVCVCRTCVSYSRSPTDSMVLSFGVACKGTKKGVQRRQT